MKRFFLLHVSTLLLLAVGCAAMGGSSTPKKTFMRLYEACINGDYVAAHDLYSHRLKQAKSVAEIEKAFSDPRVRASMKQLYKKSKFRVVSYELNHAFAEIVWSDGTRQDMTFILENAAWRLDITAVTPNKKRR